MEARMVEPIAEYKSPFEVYKVVITESKWFFTPVKLLLNFFGNEKVVGKSTGFNRFWPGRHWWNNITWGFFVVGVRMRWLAYKNGRDEIFRTPYGFDGEAYVVIFNKWVFLANFKMIGPI